MGVDAYFRHNSTGGRVDVFGCLVPREVDLDRSHAAVGSQLREKPRLNFEQGSVRNMVSLPARAALPRQVQTCGLTFGLQPRRSLSFCKTLNGDRQQVLLFLCLRGCIPAVNCCLIADQCDDVRERGPQGKVLVSHRCDVHVAEDLKPFANAKCDCGDRYPATGGFYERHVL